MLWFNQEGNIRAVEDLEGGRAWVEQGEGVAGDNGFKHWWRRIDSIEVDGNELEEEKEKG